MCDLQPDILECEVKATLGSITPNKTSRGDDRPAELFQILKEDALLILHSISSVQSFSHAQRFATPWTAAHQAFLFITNFWNLFKLMSIESVMPSTTSSFVVPFSSCLQFFPASGSFPISHFFASMAKVLEFQLQHQFFLKEYSGLISFTTDWFDLLAVQGIHKSLLQHHSLKASILWCSTFFILQLSHPYMTTGKAIALAI